MIFLLLSANFIIIVIVAIILISIIQIDITYAWLFEDVHALHDGRVLQIEAFWDLFHFRWKRDLLENLIPKNVNVFKYLILNVIWK